MTDTLLAARRFSVAPMMDWTDRHCRYFYRQMTRQALLYSEMVTTGAILHGDREMLLGHDAGENPVALQLGGSEPRDLAEAARIGVDWGYDEINLNCGCPSDRVQSGRFGACLMAEPALVAECVAAMKDAVPVPVTVKCRIGIDDQDSEADLTRFVAAVKAAGVDALVVHARKAWLQGLSPKENRDVPPLDYPRVHRLKAAFPDLPMALNGGLKTLADCAPHLAPEDHAALKGVMLDGVTLDGVMLGRAVYDNPGLLLDVDSLLFGATGQALSREGAALAMVPYIQSMRGCGVRVNRIVRHMLGLFQGVPGARAWRRILTVESVKDGADEGVLLSALDAVREAGGLEQAA